MAAPNTVRPCLDRLGQAIRADRLPFAMRGPGALRRLMQAPT